MAAQSFIRAVHATTTLALSDVVTSTQDIRSIEVVNRGTTELYVLTVPVATAAVTVGGADTFVIPPNTAAVLPNFGPTADDVVNGLVGITVQVISTAACAYTVGIPVARTVG